MRFILVVILISALAASRYSPGFRVVPSEDSLFDEKLEQSAGSLSVMGASTQGGTSKTLPRISPTGVNVGTPDLVGEPRWSPFAFSTIGKLLRGGSSIAHQSPDMPTNSDGPVFVGTQGFGRNYCLSLRVFSTYESYELALLSTTATKSQTRSQYKPLSEHAVMVVSDDNSFGDDLDGTSWISQGQVFHEWNEPMEVGKNSDGLGVLAAGVNSAFAKSVGSFSIRVNAHESVLTIGLDAPRGFSQVEYFPISELGLERGEWILEQGMMIYVFNQLKAHDGSIIPVQVRINTLLEHHIGASSSLFRMILSDVASNSVVSVDYETNKYFLGMDDVVALPTIHFHLPGGILYKMVPEAYCDLETGEVLITETDVEGHVMDIGITVIGDAVVHFDASNYRVGFSMD